MRPTPQPGVSQEEDIGDIISLLTEPPAFQSQHEEDKLPSLVWGPPRGRDASEVAGTRAQETSEEVTTAGGDEVNNIISDQGEGGSFRKTNEEILNLLRKEESSFAFNRKDDIIPEDDKEVAVEKTNGEGKVCGFEDHEWICLDLEDGEHMNEEVLFSLEKEGNIKENNIIKTTDNIHNKGELQNENTRPNSETHVSRDSNQTRSFQGRKIQSDITGANIDNKFSELANAAQVKNIDSNTISDVPKSKEKDSEKMQSEENKSEEKQSEEKESEEKKFEENESKEKESEEKEYEKKESKKKESEENKSEEKESEENESKEKESKDKEFAEKESEQAKSGNNSAATTASSLPDSSGRCDHVTDESLRVRCKVVACFTNTDHCYN